jgi:uncharacterized protein YecE (DUF72 family)
VRIEEMIAKTKPRIAIGTSGWSYQSWRGAFFPSQIMVKHHLAYYGTQFLSTELNGVFYRTPSLVAVKAWRDQTPDQFLFSWKASKYITHWKRLGKSSANSLALIDERYKILGPKAGPLLFQLPPQFKADLKRLAQFLEMLPRGRRYTFEFRDRSWYSENCLDLLQEHDVALCVSDHHDAPSPWISTASYVYVRGHGPNGTYRGHYDDRKLRVWADKIEEWYADGRDVFIYFDNDQKSAAPYDAAKLRTILRRRMLLVP